MYLGIYKIEDLTDLNLVNQKLNGEFVLLDVYTTQTKTNDDTIKSEEHYILGATYKKLFNNLPTKAPDNLYKSPLG